MAKIYKGIPYTGTLPAVLAGTKAGYLHSYKVYGNTEQTDTPTPENPIEPSECGERTENLFNYVAYYDTATSGVNIYFNIKGVLALKPNTTYTFSSNFKTSRTQSIYETPHIVSFHDEPPTTVNGGFGDGNAKTITTDSSGLLDLYTRTAKGGSSGDVDIPTLSDFENGKWIMLNEGSTALLYAPYGYKLPITSGSTPVDIFIGDDTLSTEEYVDSGTGKIYRMVGGVLTPTDPPVPFPQIPTSANSTTISWAGEGLAPSQFDSIAEWVSAVPKIYTNIVCEDAPTYVYTNGEWVADTPVTNN